MTSTTTRLAFVVAASLLSACTAGDTYFAEPRAFALLLPLLLLGLWRRRGRAATMRFPRRDLVTLTSGGLRVRLRHLPDLLRIAALIALIVALARPQVLDDALAEVEGIDLMVALDLSGSMQAVDLSAQELDAWKATSDQEPQNRFQHAVETLQRFVDSRERDRLGMVVFAESAYLHFPLTLDYQSIQQQLAELRIEMINPNGTAIGNALGIGIRGLMDSDSASRAIILITDGANMGGNISPMEAASLAADEEIPIYTILVGRDGETFIPTYSRLQRRTVYQTQSFPVDPELLDAIAEETGGSFFRAADPAHLDQNLNDILDSLERTRLEAVANVARRDVFGAWLSLAMLLLLSDGLLRWLWQRRYTL